MGVPISNQTRRVVYAASGTGPYNFSFEILANTDIAVYKDDLLLTLTTDYTVTINTNGTGSVTLTASPTGATQIAIVGNRTIQRSTDFVTGGDFFANTLNDELDQQTIFAQQNAEGLARALSAPQTDPTTINMTLPRASVRANKVLSFDSTGNPNATEFIGSYRGNWQSGTVYYTRDLVKDTSNGNIYQVNTAHTASGSQPLSTNANASKYDLIVDAASATQSATDAAASAALANDWATKTSGAVAGGEYSAKYHANAASSSASAAASSASAASSSASNASTSASNASTSATAAASSASTASTAATNAGNSATAANSSATSASNSATSATSSASTASTAATNASNSASAAATSATNASNSASAASTSATNAANSASAASNSATNAAASESAAAASATAAAASYDSFDDRYLGAKSSDPTVDNDGNALLTGALYWNSSANEMRVYNGSNWAVAYLPASGYATLAGTETLTNKTLTAPIINGGALNDATVNGVIYSRDNDGTISGGTWAIDYANGPVIKATAGANITTITMANWPASGTAGHLRLMLIKSTFTVTFPSWNWIKSDLTTTTTFADLGLTLPSAVPVLIDLFSDDGGTTIYASVVRN